MALPGANGPGMGGPGMDVCGVVLAAGRGTRLRPLTERVPKALCPVGNAPLLDSALRRMEALGLAGPTALAVNASYLGGQVVDWVGERAHVSVEPDGPLGTSGALGQLLDWIDGRGVLLGNADAYLDPPDMSALLAGWDGRTVRMLGIPTEPTDPFRFGTHQFAGLSLLPWHRVRTLTSEPSEVVRTIWRPAEADGELEVITHRGTYMDTGTPRDYLAANLHAAMLACGQQGGLAAASTIGAPSVCLIAPDATVTGRCEHSVVGAGAIVHGDLIRSVVWPGAHVPAGEILIDAIRAADGLTVTALAQHRPG